MDYTTSYTALKELFTSIEGDQCVQMTDTIEVHNLQFSSDANDILPGVDTYHCRYHDLEFRNEYSFFTDIGKIRGDVHIKDVFIEENKSFHYQLIKPKDQKVARKVTFLFHGFNEKDWDKYLPWAQAICEGTGSTVVLFPIAFHMQRAPKHWSSKRAMFMLSEERKKRFPNVVNSSLSNVAISMRLHTMPQRFIWSGLQTYYDMIRFIELCKEGSHPLIHKDFDFNIFAYSIGGFLAQILKLTNYKDYFMASRVCLFCGGATFNRMSPVSKFILDSEANVALYSFLVEHFDKILQKDKLLNHYIKEDHTEGKVFYSMLDYQKMRDYREGLLKKYEDQIYAISLKKDSVVPSFEIMNTLKGAYRDINIHVDEFDFDFSYTHENPFPASTTDSKTVDEGFKKVFKKACNFLNNNE